MIEVTQAQPSDIEGLVKVHRASSVDAYARPEYGLTEADVAAKDFDSAEKIAKRKYKLLDESLGCWVAKDGHEVVGFCYAKKNESFNQVEAIYIHPDRQGQGIGKLLLAVALPWLGSEKQIVIEVASINDQAIGFYRRHGFEVEGEPTDHPYTDTIVMKVARMVRPGLEN